jgi:acetyl-CoA carboxylase biotin carboxyl carrier protein
VAGTNDERATIARLTEEVVPTLIERLSRSDLGEIEVRQDGWRVRLRRGAGEPAAPVAQGHGHAHAATQSPPHKPAAVAHTDVQPRREPARGHISSPAVGYFTPRDGMTVGAKLRKGDLIGVVDMLGVRQDVVSPSDGVLKELDVESGQAVEYGQPIGRVEAQAQSQAANV